MRVKSGMAGNTCAANYSYHEPQSRERKCCLIVALQVILLSLLNGIQYLSVAKPQRPNFIPKRSSQCFISVKSYHVQSNSYKEKHIIGAGLHIQRFSSFPILTGNMAAHSRHGTREGTENSIFRFAESKERFQAQNGILEITKSNPHLWVKPDTPPPDWPEP